MNFNDIINQLSSTAPEELEKKEDRRNILKSFGVKLAVAAVPFAAGSLFTNKAYGQSKETIINVLNYLLKLEYISDKLYTEALMVDQLAPVEFKTQFNQIATNTKSHIGILQTIITDLGGTVATIDYANIDLNGNKGFGGGSFQKALTNTSDFLVLAQVLSDGGGRMYKGMITEVFSDKTTVRALVNIHSVKARHAAFIRFMRVYWVGDDVKPWITGTNSDTTNTAAQRAYSGETPTTQSGIEIVGINGFNITADAATQAFDEPLIMIDGNNILDRFLKP